jgi:hypothetical protein
MLLTRLARTSGRPLRCLEHNRCGGNHPRLEGGKLASVMSLSRFVIASVER